MTAAANPFAKYADALQSETASGTPLGLQAITLFGAEGTGKSTVASQFPNHMYLDLEASAVELERTSLKIPKTWSAFKDFVTSIDDASVSPFDGKTLVIDTVTDLWDLCLRHELAQRKLTALPDDFGRTLKAIRTEFKRTVGCLLSLRMKGRLGTIFIAHEESEEIKTPTATYHVFRPKVDDKDIRGWIAAKPQMVLRCSKEDVNPVTNQPWPDGVSPRYVIRTQPITSSDVVKDRSKSLPKFVGSSYKALADAYNKNTATKKDDA